MLAANYMAINNVRYELYTDHIRYYETQVFILITSEDIPYDNIIRVNARSEGFMDKLMSCGDVVIGLTNYRRESVTLASIDNPAMIATRIQSKLNEYNMHKQMVYQESNKISNIMNRF